MRSTLVDGYSLQFASSGLPWVPQGSDGTEADTETPETTEETDEDGSSTEEDEEQEPAKLKEQMRGLQRKIEQMRAQLSASDKNKSAAQKQLEELQRKERTELENAKADAEKFGKEAEGWKTKFQTLALTNAFLTESMRAKVVWHNPTVAQRAAEAELRALTINEDDGSVDGIADVIKKLAKEQSFLVNSSAGTNGDGTEDDSKGKETKRPSGSNVGGGGGKGKGKPGELSTEELLRRFPALKQ